MIVTASAKPHLEWIRSYADARINGPLWDERRSLPPYVVLDFGNQGLLGLAVPRSHGGLGLDGVSISQILQQIAAVDLTLAVFVGWIGNSFAFVPPNARVCGVFRVGDRCFSR